MNSRENWAKLSVMEFDFFYLLNIFFQNDLKEMLP